MKRIIKCAAIFLTLCLLLALLAGCTTPGSSLVTTRPYVGEKDFSVVVTIFPIYDWMMNILGEEAENFEIVLLMQNGSDLHNFTPGLADMQKIHAADLFVCVGGESDAWVPEAMKSKTNEDMISLSLMEHMGDALWEEEYVEGMVHEEEADEDEEETEYDEHIWLSLRNAGLACTAISEALCRLDPAHEAVYQKNTETYLASLKALDQRYTEAVAAAPLHTLVFADRFPFRYLVEDYGLDYYAAYAGCSSDIGTSITTVPFLTGKVDELGVKYILRLENNASDLPEKVAAGAASDGIGILSLNSMQFVSRADIDGGASYLGIMEANLEVLTKALSVD